MSTESAKATKRLWPQLLRIYRLAAPFRWALLGALLLSLLATAASLGLPLGVRALLDSALEQGDRRLLDRLTLALLGLFTVWATLSFAGSCFMRITGERIVASLRKRFYRHLHRLDLLYFGDQKVGDLTSRLNVDTASIRSTVTDTVAATLQQSLLLLGSIVLMAAMNWRLSLIVLLTTPVAALLSHYYSPTLRRLARTLQERVGKSSAVAHEALSSMPAVKTFARSAYETSRFDRTVDSLYRASRRSTLIGTTFGSLLTAASAAASIAIFWFGGIEVLASRLSPGDLVAFLFYSQNITQGIGQMAQIHAGLSAAAGASERLFEVLDIKPQVEDSPRAIVLSNPRASIQFDRVSFSYQPGRPALDGISFQAKAGETIALVGPSGAGKTTLLQLIPRLFDPTQGRVLFDGHDLRALSLQHLREQVSIVAQDVYLFADSVRENIRYGRLDASDREVESAARAANAHDFIQALPDGYDTPIGERGTKLSGGQRQRISIARALLKDAPILILDEATSSIDSESEAQIQEAIERLRCNRTTFISAHRLGTVANAGRILVLQAGRLIEWGDHDELIASGGLYSRLIDLQFRRPTTRLVEAASHQRG